MKVTREAANTRATCDEAATRQHQADAGDFDFQE